MCSGAAAPQLLDPTVLGEYLDGSGDFGGGGGRGAVAPEPLWSVLARFSHCPVGRRWGGGEDLWQGRERSGGCRAAWLDELHPAWGAQAEQRGSLPGSVLLADKWLFIKLSK